MVTAQAPCEGLTPTEQSLVDHVRRGEWLDLAVEDEAVDEAAMRSWGDSRTCRATVIRDILLGRLSTDPDPHGLRLRGARICGRLDLENLTTDVNLELTECLLEAGVQAQSARMASVGLTGCRLEHPAKLPLDAARLICSVLDLSRATIIGHAVTAAVRLAGAHIDGNFDCTGARLDNDSGPALIAEGVQVGQDVFLRGGFTATATGGGEYGAVRLAGARIGGKLDCAGARMGNDSGPALIADGLQVGQAMFLRGGFTATGAGEEGAVRLIGAHIGIQLVCVGVCLSNDTGPALIARGLQVYQNIYLGGEFGGSGEFGAVSLTGARIGGNFDCAGARLRNDSGPALIADSVQVGQAIYLRDGFTATGGGPGVAIDLTGMQVGGAILLDLGGLKHATDSDRLVVVDGLSYAGVPKLASARDWARLLRDGTDGYAAQPYQQLAAGYRALGDDRKVRKIVIAQRDDQLARTHPRWPERLWGWITKVTLGYGYQPWRALLFLAAVVALSCLLAVVLGSHGALAQTDNTATPGRPCTVVQKVSVGLDLNLPAGTSVARADCDLTKDSTSAVAAWLSAGGWVLQLLAWAFAALFIAGFTSAVRKT